MLNLFEKLSVRLRNLVKNETAAVTVDWVVLSAGIIVLVAGVLSAIEIPVGLLETAISDAVTSASSGS